MAKTANSYIPDAPSVKVTISATNVTDHTEFTTAESLEMNTSLKSVSPQVPPRPATETMVAGADEPILTRSTKYGGKVTLELQVVDDHMVGGTGEIGTDTLTAWETFNAFFQSGKTMGGLAYSPAGAVTGRMKIVANGNCFVEHCGMPQADASGREAASFPVTISAEYFTVAANT